MIRNDEPTKQCSLLFNESIMYVVFTSNPCNTCQRTLFILGHCLKLAVARNCALSAREAKWTNQPKWKAMRSAWRAPSWPALLPSEVHQTFGQVLARVGQLKKILVGLLSPVCLATSSGTP